MEKLVTKKDLKKDLEKFATKKDLKELRQETKKDFKNLEEKMDNKFDAAFHMFASKDDLKELKTELKQEMATKSDIDRVLTAIDSVVKEQQDSRMERTANIGAHDRIEADIVKTNKRVTVVEKKIEAISVAR